LADFFKKRTLWEMKKSRKSVDFVDVLDNTCHDLPAQAGGVVMTKDQQSEPA
jgi:hypothetical protein